MRENKYEQTARENRRIGTTQEAIADAIGIARSTFYRKLKKDGTSFTIGEAHKIIAAIPLSVQEAVEIFLGA